MGFLRKLVGLFVERVEVDEHGRPIKRAPQPANSPPKPGGSARASGSTSSPPPPSAPAAQPVPYAHPAVPAAPVQPAPAGHPSQAAPNPHVAPHPHPHPSPTPHPHLNPPTGAAGTHQGAAPGTQVAIALRAHVPAEYAAHLAPHGLHVIAARPDITSEQALGWGAQALVVSAECLGRELALLHQPQLPTVFIAPQQVMLPPHPGIVQVQEPLHASDVARAVVDAISGWHAGTSSAPAPAPAPTPAPGGWPPPGPAGAGPHGYA